VGLDEMVHDLLDGPLARHTRVRASLPLTPVEKFLDGGERRSHALPKLRCGSTASLLFRYSFAFTCSGRKVMATLYLSVVTPRVTPARLI
jgi:hypothetical protein